MECVIKDPDKPSTLWTMPDHIMKSPAVPGGIFFVPAGTCVTISAEQSLTVWAAACNSNFFALQEIRDSAAKAADTASLIRV